MLSSEKQHGRDLRFGFGGFGSEWSGPGHWCLDTAVGAWVRMGPSCGRQVEGTLPGPIPPRGPRAGLPSRGTPLACLLAWGACHPWSWGDLAWGAFLLHPPGCAPVKPNGLLTSCS